ncbi:MAG: acyl-CoA desaturase [Bacteroidetes bacterium]|nr:acyl-CoA desaturase [Bacteroidota bacterium]
MPILIFFVAHWYLSLFSQSFFHHRYGAHAAFGMSRSAEKFFFILSWLTMGSSYLSPRVYALMHRLHHAYADTELDPHSPKYSKNVFDMMWRTRRIYLDIWHGRTIVEEKFSKNLPEWKWLDKWGNNFFSRILWVAAYTAFYVAFAPSFWWYLLLPVQIASGAVHGAIINWYAHKYGYINFRVRNTSQNLFSIDILMWGESYHNNHHKFATSANFGRRWHEIDPMYGVIKLLNWMRVIHLKKPTLVLAAEIPKQA